MTAAVRGPDLWSDPNPIRAEIFGPERLDHHALSLAAAQKIGRAPRVSSLRARLEDNARALVEAYRGAVAAVETGQAITPAAEWLLDNIHIVEAQIAQIRDDLPPGYYRHLPKLVTGASGRLSAHPRPRLGLCRPYRQPFGRALAAAFRDRLPDRRAPDDRRALGAGHLVAHRAGRKHAASGGADRAGYRRAQRGRCLGRCGRLRPDARRHGVARPHGRPDRQAPARHGPVATPLAIWLDQSLRARGGSLETVVQVVQARQGASNVTMRNIVTSMRRMAEMDWADVFEDLSLIEARLRATPLHAQMDFATRNDYRSAIETLARGARQSEMAVTEMALARAGEQDPGFVLLGPGRGALERALGLPLWLRRFRLRQGLGLAAYLSAVALASGLFLALAVWLQPGAAVVALVAVDAGLALVHLAVGRLVAPRRLPGLSLKQGIPETCRTLVVMPVLLSGPRDLAEVLGRLEVHHLSSVGGAVQFALLSDGPDAEVQSSPTDPRPDRRSAGRHRRAERASRRPLPP